VRVAFSGAHRTGKTTLVGAIAERMPTYVVIDEPYGVLEEAGYEFADPPTVEDFEEQLRTSLESIARAPADALFDRCPLDFVAYLQAIDEDYDVDDRIDELGQAMARLDLVVVVPIEDPDRIAVAAHEDRRLRRRVNERVQRLAIDDAFGFEVETIEVMGPLEERVRQVMRAMR
jgi:predicted ATPase